MSRKKLVFLVDVNPVIFSDGAISIEEYCQQIHFATLKILAYFFRIRDFTNNGLHPIWGFKFYDSFGGQFDLGKQNHFYDLEIKDFEIFEMELEKRIVNGQKIKKKALSPISHQLSCALVDIVSEYQWERPEFFSPKKSMKSRLSFAERKFNDELMENNPQCNFVFLFTPCPNCCGKVKYFEQENLQSVSTLQNALIKKELYEKLVNVNKIALYWVDTGKNSDKKVQNSFHSLLSQVLKSLNGSLIPLGLLFSMWVKKETNGSISMENIFCQSVSFYSMMDALLFHSRERAAAKSSSVGGCTLLLSLKDFCFLTMNKDESSDANVVIPLKITAASIEIPNFKSIPNIKKKESQSARNLKFNPSSGIFVQKFKEKTSKNENELNIANVKGVIKRKDCYLMLKNIGKSYYCYFDSGAEILEGKESSCLVYQKLLKLLFQKHLILIIDLHDPDNGNITDGFLHALTEKCAIVTIWSPCGNLVEYSHDQPAGKLLDKLEMMNENINKKLVKLAYQSSIQAEKQVKVKYSDEFPQKNRTEESFMQSLEHWFCELPHQSLSDQLHQQLKSLRNCDGLCEKKTSQQASSLLSKLKETYKRNSDEIDSKEKQTDEKKRVKTKSPKLKLNLTSYSQKLLAKSKAVKAKKKLNETMQQQEKVLNREADTQKTKAALQLIEIDKKQESDEINHSNENSFLNIDELSLHLKNEISSILVQDVESCDKYSNKLAKTLVLCRRKMNEGFNVDELIECEKYLDGLFHEFEEFLNGKKEAKVSRYILHALLHLDIAVFLKSVTTQWESVADKVVNLLRRVMFLEDPSFVSKYIKNVILAKYKIEIPTIILDIYEGLALDPPNELLSPSKIKQEQQDSPESSDAESVLCSNFNSNISSSHSSINRRQFRRFSSIGDSMMNRQITVPTKKGQKVKTKRKISPVNNESTVGSSREGWCRNLFDEDSDNNRKRKFQRRHSELVSSVKDTPRVKQKRHTIWKKQHGERRKSRNITDITVIKESPLKDFKEDAVTQKRASRLLFDSVSITSKSSPNRFYSFKRNNSCLSSENFAANRKLFRRTASCITSSVKNSFNENSKEEQTGFNHAFYSCVTSPTGVDDAKCMSVSPLRKDNFGNIPCKVDSFKISDDRQDLLSEVLDESVTPEKNNSYSKDWRTEKTAGKFHTTPKKEPRIDQEIRKCPYLGDVTPKNLVRSFVPFSHSLNITREDGQKSKPAGINFKEQIRHDNFAVSEDSMDWVSLFEKDNSEKEKRNDVISLPCTDENELQMSTSPDLFTPNRDEKQHFSSPFLSVSSLETLEKAPILSPGLKKSKQGKNASCRKRINVLSGDF